VIGLIASVGLWLLKRWSFWLTIVVAALNLLSSAPGIAVAPGAVKVVPAVFVLVSVVIIVLVARPASRRALAAS